MNAMAWMVSPVGHVMTSGLVPVVSWSSEPQMACVVEAHEPPMHAVPPAQLFEPPGPEPQQLVQLMAVGHPLVSTLPGAQIPYPLLQVTLQAPLTHAGVSFVVGQTAPPAAAQAPQLFGFVSTSTSQPSAFSWSQSA
jgi:hypothetical protein